MRKKHGYEALLKYMRMLEEGYSIRFIRREYGINETRLKRLWILYQKYGSSVLHRKSYTQTDGKLRQEIVSDIEKNHLTLLQASLKYDVSNTQLSVWLKTAKEHGIEALLIKRKRGRLPGMGRHKKKKPEEMTELELLQIRVRQLEIENALLKKVKALVEEKKARLRAIGRGQSEN